MTPQEFKAWFEGFTEAFSGTPTKAQWARIKDRVAEIDGKSVTEKVFIDRYLPQYIYTTPYWQQLPARYFPYTSTISPNTSSSYVANVQNAAFNSVTAMHALGRNDAQALVK